MKKSEELLKEFKKMIKEVKDSDELEGLFDHISEQLNQLVIAQNKYHSEYPKAMITLDNGETLKAYENEVYKSSMTYRFGSIYSKNEVDYIYLNPERSHKANFKKKNQFLIDLGYVLKENFTLIYEELTPLNEQNLPCRVDNIRSAGNRVQTFKEIYWHDKDSEKKIPSLQVTTSWTYRSRYDLTMPFENLCNMILTPQISIKDQVSKDKAFDHYNVYVKFKYFEELVIDQSKKQKGILINTLNTQDKHYEVFIKGDAIENKRDILKLNQELSNYDAYRLQKEKENEQKN